MREGRKKIKLKNVRKTRKKWQRKRNMKGRKIDIRKKIKSQEEYEEE